MTRLLEWQEMQENKMTIPVYCFTSDKYNWSLEIFSYLYMKYWGWPITFVGYTKPEFELPGDFYSIGNFADYPADKWSNGVLKFIRESAAPYFVFMLEDYWINRQVDTQALEWLHEYAIAHPRIARVDITTDRLYGANLQEVEPLRRLDIIENIPAAPYHLSLQAGIWSRDAFLKYVFDNESAWEVEIKGTSRMINDGARVVGTRNFPLRYLIGIQQGKVAMDGGYQQPAPKFTKDDSGFIVSTLSKRNLA